MTDFIVANFNGTGTLTGYVPDTGSTFTAPSMYNIPDGTFGHGLSNTAMLAYLTRNAPGGAMQQITANPWGDDFFLYNPNTVPPSPDYYIESVLKIPVSGYSYLNAFCSHCHRIKLGTGGDVGYFDCIYTKFNVEEIDPTHRQVRTINIDRMTALSTSPSVSVGSYVTLVPLPILLGAATSVKFRSEVEGKNLRAFINDVLIVTAVLVDATNYFATAGRVGWSFQFEGSDTYSAAAYDSLKAGTDFVPPPVVVPGAFWTEYVKTKEALDTVLLADIPPPPPRLAPLPPVITPVAAGDFFLDNFNGTGSLVGRSPEIGGAYTGASLNKATFTSDGWLNFFDTARVYSSVVLPPMPYALEARVVFVTPPAPGQTFQFQFGFDWLATLPVVMIIYRPNTTFALGCYLDDAAGGFAYQHVDANPGVILNVPFVARIEVSSAGVKWFLDGVLKASTPFLPPSNEPIDRIYFYPDSALGVARVDYVASSTPAPPVIPGFWTEYVKATEMP